MDYQLLFAGLTALTTNIDSSMSPSAPISKKDNLQKRVNLLLQSSLIGTDNLAHLLSILVDTECRHGADPLLLRNFWGLIDIDLDEVDFVGVFWFVGHLDDGWGDGFAGTAPGGEEVDDDEFAGGAFDYGGLEGGHTVDMVNAALLSCACA